MAAIVRSFRRIRRARSTPIFAATRSRTSATGFRTDNGWDVYGWVHNAFDRGVFRLPLDAVGQHWPGGRPARRPAHVWPDAASVVLRKAEAMRSGRPAMARPLIDDVTAVAISGRGVRERLQHHRRRREAQCHTAGREPTDPAPRAGAGVHAFLSYWLGSLRASRPQVRG